MQSLVNSLTKLRAVRWIGGATPPQAFDKAQITVSFTTSPDDKASHKLIVGGPAGEGMWYGRVEGRAGIFILSNPDFNALRLPLNGSGRALAERTGCHAYSDAVARGAVPVAPFPRCRSSRSRP